MTISAVRHSNGAFTSGHIGTSSFGTLPTAGDAVVVVAWGEGSSSVTGLSCTDNQGVGNVYTQVGAKGTATYMCVVFCCPSIGATSGTFTVTVTLNSSINAMDVGAEEFTALTLPVDVTQSATGTSTAPATGTTAATAQADEVAVAVFTDNGNNETQTQPSGYSTILSDPNGTTQMNGAGVFKVLSATGTQSATWTASNAGWAATIACLKGAAGGGVPVVGGDSLLFSQAVRRATLW